MMFPCCQSTLHINLIYFLRTKMAPKYGATTGILYRKFTVNDLTVNGFPVSEALYQLTLKVQPFFPSFVYIHIDGVFACKV